ncbi:DNA mismatch repair endonuclease MutL [Anaerosporobacter faecicola]|uniref:DNA mismatch repair endonuclease MutL n=1 Tax=Anaerosporobacter faecicola TaxID=2718714 RepID=UPI00143AF24C|nr:DNA mismatch repair endonuclease MutL [Anaerosporobacter faecicola]
MAKIELLDQNTINQIAAGEVIERPAAVVKELIENAIDAKANAITVEIKEGGISFIRITDNGGGIAKDDIKVAFLRHSTSKIRSALDLLHVSSLGFRGEALSSIAAVAQVELVTKTPGELTGTRYVIEGGVEKTMEEIGCPEGTTFLIRNLFYNTPARRKFLKSATTEASYIGDIIERIAISHPHISFKFMSNNQVKLHTSGNGNLKDIIYNVYGREIASNVVQVKESSENVQVEGFIGKPIISRGNRNYENYYINGRYVKSSIVNKAIEEAYKSYTMSHRYPFTAIHLHIPGEFIDVNVHPTKMEIRFRNSEEVYTTVYHTIKDCLSGRELIPAVTLVEQKEKEKRYENTPEPFEKNRLRENKNQGGNTRAMVKETEIGRMKEIIKHPHEAIQQNRKESHSGKDFETKENQVTEVPQKGQAEKCENRLVSKEESYEHKVDQSRRLENNNGELYLTNQNTINQTKGSQYEDSITPSEAPKVDDARIQENEVVKEAETYGHGEQISLFEDKLISERARPRQRIIGQLFATYWIVEYDDKMFMIDQHAAHEKVLYEKLLASYKNKDNTAQMLQPPIILSLSMREEDALKKQMSVLQEIGFEIEHFGGKEYSVRSIPNNLLGIAEREYLIELIDSLVEDNHTNLVESLLEKAASMSCKAAVKGNNKLSFEEANALIDELLQLENPYNCPHGRPTIISMSKYEIEKKFKRII